MIGKLLTPAFWAKVGSVSIRSKILGIVAICILTSALALVWYTFRDVSVAMKNELQQRGIAIGTSLAAQSRDLILTNNQFNLYTLVTETRDANADLSYIFVLDTGGNILVHTFGEGFPVELLEINILKPDERNQVQVLETENDTIHDIAVPVLGGAAGIVRVGMSEATINAVIINHIRNITIWVASVLTMGLALAYGLAYILTEPISQLVAAAKAVGRGDFRWKSPLWAKDEIGSLGAAFDEMSEELKQKEEMRGRLLGKVISAQEEERKRIARELHDETGQALTSLMVGLKFIEDSSTNTQAKKQTSQLRALASQTLDEVHRLATELRPSLLDDLGLPAAIQRYTREYAAKMNIDVDSYISGLDERRLPSEIEVSVYRIIQEALTNIAKYAKASQVSVVLRQRDSSLVAIIEDNGKGFDIDGIMSSKGNKRLGLFGMYERASLIGGNLTIESQPGNGTSVFLEVPLKNSVEASYEQNKAAYSR